MFALCLNTFNHFIPRINVLKYETDVILARIYNSINFHTVEGNRVSAGISNVVFMMNLI